MTLATQILILILLTSAIGAVVRLFFVLGDVHRLLGKVEATRREVDSTLQRLEAVAQVTERTLRDEVAPALHVVRRTLENVETATRALADTTAAARNIAGQTERLLDSQKLVLTAGGAIARWAAHRSAGALSGLLSALGLAGGSAGAAVRQAGSMDPVLESGALQPEGGQTSRNGGSSGTSRSTERPLLWRLFGR